MSQSRWHEVVCSLLTFSWSWEDNRISLCAMDVNRARTGDLDPGSRSKSHLRQLFSENTLWSGSIRTFTPLTMVKLVFSSSRVVLRSKSLLQVVLVGAPLAKKPKSRTKRSSSKLQARMGRGKRNESTCADCCHCCQRAGKQLFLASSPRHANQWTSL